MRVMIIVDGKNDFIDMPDDTPPCGMCGGAWSEHCIGIVIGPPKHVTISTETDDGVYQVCDTTMPPLPPPPEERH